MHKESRSASEGCEEVGSTRGGARACEGAQFCSGQGWEQGGLLWPHDTAQVPGWWLPWGPCRVLSIEP